MSSKTGPKVRAAEDRKMTFRPSLRRLGPGVQREGETVEKVKNFFPGGIDKGGKLCYNDNGKIWHGKTRLGYAG